MPCVNNNFAGVIVALQVCYGYYQVIQSNIERRKLKEERRERRAAILPFLQAEEDIKYLREYSKYLDEEKRVMKDVVGRFCMA